MFKKVAAALLVLTLLFTMGGAATAEDNLEPGYMILSGDYQLDGKIDWVHRSGSSNTGGEQVILINGEGSLETIRWVEMQHGRLDVEQIITWQTYEKALRNLTVISATKVGIPPIDEVYGEPTEQIYAIYMSPDRGELGYLKQNLGVHYYNEYLVDTYEDYDDYYYTFFVDTEAQLTQGMTKRFLSLSGEKSYTRVFDNLEVKGMVSIKEALDFADVVVPLEGTVAWWDLF